MKVFPFHWKKNYLYIFHIFIILILILYCDNSKEKLYSLWGILFSNRSLVLILSIAELQFKIEIFSKRIQFLDNVSIIYCTMYGRFIHFALNTIIAIFHTHTGLYPLFFRKDMHLSPFIPSCHKPSCRPDVYPSLLRASRPRHDFD